MIVPTPRLALHFSSRHWFSTRTVRVLRAGGVSDGGSAAWKLRLLTPAMPRLLPMKETAMEQLQVEKPFRVGVFDTVAHADRAVRNLLAAGFTKDKLSVICSDRYKEQFFH